MEIKPETFVFKDFQYHVDMTCHFDGLNVNDCAKLLKLLQKLFFQMIILLYLVVIFGWALLILIIKCRKAREKRIAMEQQEGELRKL